MELRDYARVQPAVRNTKRHQSSLIAQTLLRIVNSVDLTRLDTLSFRTTDGDRQSAELGEVGRFELTAVRWPVGSIMPLRGYGDGPSLFRVVVGTLVEHRFDAAFLGYRYRRVSRGFRTNSQLLVGGFHFLVAVERSLSIHVQAGSDDLATSAVPESELPKLRDAFNRDVAEGSSPTPPRLLATLSGAP